MSVFVGARALALLSIGAMGPGAFVLLLPAAGANDTTAAHPGAPRAMEWRETSRKRPEPVPEDLHGRLIERVLEVYAAWRDLDVAIASLERVVRARPEDRKVERRLETLLAAREQFRRQRGRWNEPWSGMLVPRVDPAGTLRDLGAVYLHLAELSHLRALAYAHVESASARSPMDPALAEMSPAPPDVGLADSASTRAAAGAETGRAARMQVTHGTGGAPPAAASGIGAGLPAGPMAPATTPTGASAPSGGADAVPLGASHAPVSPGAASPLPETAQRYLTDVKESLTSVGTPGESTEPMTEPRVSDEPGIPADAAGSRPWWHWALFTYASVAAAVLLLLGGRMLVNRLTGHGRHLERRLRRVAAPLATPAAAQAQAQGAESIFRAKTRKSRFGWLAWPIESRYPLLDARRALPIAVGGGVAAAALAWFSLWFLKIPAGVWTLPVCAVAGAGGLWYALGWQQTKQEAAFVRQFPEVVDQVVRLAGAGVPSVEALSVVTRDAPAPIRPILERVCDALLAGVDPDTALRMETARTRLAEFTMFAAVLRLQRRAGGGVSTAFANLSRTLRERHRSSLKAQASTAQSRLTLLVLAVMPVVVLIGQKFTAPESVEMLFGTESGTTLLRAGTGLIVFGLLVARTVAARAARG